MIEADIRVALRSSPRLLCVVRALVRKYTEIHGVPSKRVDQVVLAVDEACTNAIRHSYSGCEDRELNLTLMASGEFIEFCLEDNGSPAPAEHMAPRDQASPDPEAIRPGGLGIQIIHQVFDEVKFDAVPGGGNRVVMRLRQLSPGSAVSSAGSG